MKAQEVIDEAQEKRDATKAALAAAKKTFEEAEETSKASFEAHRNARQDAHGDPAVAAAHNAYNEAISKVPGVKEAREKDIADNEARRAALKKYQDAQDAR